LAKLYFFYAAMNAGKTTHLLQSDFNYRERGMSTLLFAPAVDHRYGQGQVTSRIGLAREAVVFSPEFDFVGHVRQSVGASGVLPDCVMVDEAQFLVQKQVRDLTDIVDQLGIPVLAYGLRTDFLGQPFEGSRYLLAWADELVEIKTVCHCGRKAVMNSHRAFPPDTDPALISTVDIGGNEKYQSTCRLHFRQHVCERSSGSRSHPAPQQGQC
jgi:thymidine kinase